MSPSNPFPKFVATLPPVTEGVDAVVPCSASAVERWAPFLPESLIAFWQAVGWGGFGDGVIHVVDPAQLQPVLSLWLGEESPRRVPFARSAFGEIFYWRDMQLEAAAQGMTGENPGELGDVSVVDVHFQEIDVIALSMEQLFEEAFTDEGFIERFLRRSLVRAAREIYGPLGPSEQLAFVPALALGGFDDLASVQKVDMFVQQSILQQLA